MTAFIIKSVICMVLLFGLYWILLRKEKLFVFNRYFLIGSVLFSFFVPFISIPVYPVYSEQTQDISSMINGTGEKSPAPSITDPGEEKRSSSGNFPYTSPVTPARNEKIPVPAGRILLVIYLAGLAVMLFRFCRNIHSVIKLLRIAEKIDNEWYRIALIENNISPFSFLSTVYLNKGDYLGERIAPNVLRHELEHVRQFHSRDIIFFEVIHIIFWFNPVLLLYKSAARINHEYLADDAVIRNIQDMKNYALELINFVSRRVTMPFTSGFSPSMIRLRLLMLNTSTSRRAKNSRMLITLVSSLVMLAVLSFSPDYSNPQSRKKKHTNDDIVIEEVFFRGTDFRPLKAQVVLNGRLLGSDKNLIVDPQQIKYIDILKDKEARRKYGKNAVDGVIEISTYDEAKGKVADSLYYKEIFTVNNRVPEGIINIPVSNLYSSSIWTYPIFPNQTSDKQWRTFEIMTRDFYRIQGKVIKENGEPLSGVYVTATDHPSGVRTDSEGRFLLEDVKSDAMAELRAEGFEPLFFKVSGGIYTLDLKITLDEKNGSSNGLKNMSVSYIISDFSGSWSFNKDLSRSSRPFGYKLLYNIHQYDGDSIFMYKTTTIPTSQEFRNNDCFVFNTVKSRTSNQYKHKISCSIEPDGKSFTVIKESKNMITSWQNKSSENYSLSEDGNQLFIRTLGYKDSKSPGEEIELLVFDRI